MSHGIIFSRLFKLDALEKYIRSSNIELKFVTTRAFCGNPEEECKDTAILISEPNLRQV